MKYKLMVDNLPGKIAHIVETDNIKLLKVVIEFLEAQEGGG